MAAQRRLSQHCFWKVKRISSKETSERPIQGLAHPDLRAGAVQAPAMDFPLSGSVLIISSGTCAAEHFHVSPDSQGGIPYFWQIS